MKNIFKAGAISLSVLVGSNVNAAAIVGTPGAYTGISNLQIGATFYDVTFKDMTYDQIWSVSSPTFLNQQNAANDAAIAIRDFLNGQTISPSSIIGLGSNTFEEIVVPYDSASFWAYYVQSYNQGAWDRYPNSLGAWPDPTAGSAYVFADFSIHSSAAVPEPAVLSLLAAGIAAFRLGRKGRFNHV